MKPINSIILIDDDRVFNLINEKTINQASFAIRVKAYINAEMALKELQTIIDNNPTEFPEVIFLDINMPGMDGWEFLERYRELQPEAVKNCRIYMLSSSVNPEDVARSKTFEMVYDYFPKPLNIDKLVELRERIRGNN